MFGTNTLRDTWNTQWGPAPVGALYGSDGSGAKITLPGFGTQSPTRRRTTRATAQPRLA